MSLTLKKIAKVTLNVATHPLYSGGNLVAGTYDFNNTESLPVGAVITGVTSDEITNMVGGTSVVIKAGTLALTDAIATASFTGLNKFALASSADALKVATTANLKFTTIGTYTSGVINVYIEYIF